MSSLRFIHRNAIVAYATFDRGKLAIPNINQVFLNYFQSINILRQICLTIAI